MNANHKGLESMLEDIKEFLNDGDKETLETLMTVMEMMNMDDGAKQDILSGYMDMFGM
jgi:predicted house-cleaning noncanonical NTP pyrophosphatase (MazG superfamily)